MMVMDTTFIMENMAIMKIHLMIIKMNQQIQLFLLFYFSLFVLAFAFLCVNIVKKMKKKLEREQL